MKRSLTACIICVILLTNSLALACEDIGFYGGGGSWVGNMQIQLDNLNELLVANQFAPLDNTILIIGGHGAGGPSNWNVGGWGGAGTVTSVKGNKEATLSISFGGFHMERCTTLGTLTLTGGVLVGGGTADMVIRNKVAQGDLDAIIAIPTENRITSDFFALAPTLGLRIRMSEFTWLRVQGAYFTSVGKWQFQNNTVSGMPVIKGPIITMGVVWGLSVPAVP